MEIGKKRKLWDNNRTVTELINGTMYLNGTSILLVRLPTDDEAEGIIDNEDIDWLESEVNKNECETYVITHTLDAKKVKDALKEVN